MDKPSRFVEIDILRGVAVFAMILIHVNYFYISDKIAFVLWNYSQFAVPVFIFCSSYLFFIKKKDVLSLNYFKKRFIRLLLPYWVFLIFFIPLVILNEPGKVSFSYILGSILAIGGVDISWLVLLFLIFSILFPIISYFFEKQKILFAIYAIISVFVSLFLVFAPIPLNYKFLMWIPWSTVALFSVLFIKFEHKKRFFPFFLTVSFVLFVFLLFVQINLNHTLSFVNNKYPPNLYFLSFGIFSISLLFLFAKLKLFKPLNRGIAFLSVNSYSVYFIHYLVLYLSRIFLKNLPWYGLFSVVLIFTVLIQIYINKFALSQR